MNLENDTRINFTQLDLDERLLKALNAQDITHCTEIQAACIPIALKGKDIAGQAQTGTGKTAAFLLVMMQRLLHQKRHTEQNPQQPRAIVIAPTRELAIQIHRDALAINRYAGLSLGLVYGGVDYEKQRTKLQRRLDILIGTPGRLIDYHKQHIFSLKGIEIAVLDEADRMFDLGFINDIRYMFRSMPEPKKRLNMLFSATLSPRVNELSYDYMNRPQRIVVDAENVTAKNITQVLYHVANKEKISLLLGLIQNIDPKRSIIFINTKRVAEKVCAYLEINGFNAAILSGDVPQKKRQRILNEFSVGKLPILVATDLAARGLHVPEISHVFNYDLPQNAEDYVHRIGRTARAGSTGDAISFACENFVYSLAEIEKYIGHRLDVVKVEANLLIQPKKPPKKIPRKQPIGAGRPRKIARKRPVGAGGRR